MAPLRTGQERLCVLRVEGQWRQGRILAMLTPVVHVITHLSSSIISIVVTCDVFKDSVPVIITCASLVTLREAAREWVRPALGCRLIRRRHRDGHGCFVSGGVVVMHASG